jgi:hypothetical protein
MLTPLVPWSPLVDPQTFKTLKGVSASREIANEIGSVVTASVAYAVLPFGRSSDGER